MINKTCYQRNQQASVISGIHFMTQSLLDAEGQKKYYS